MKKIMVGVIVGILMLSGFAWAGELEEAQLQYQILDLKYQLFEEKQNVLQFQAKELQQMILVLQAQAKAKTTAKQPSKADEKGVELNPHEVE